MQSPGFEPAKAAANAAFREGRHQAAVAGYTRALSLVLHVNAADAAVCLSNRSLVQLKLGRKREALFDAEQAVAMRPTWSKAMFRLHSALVALGRSADARLVSARAKELKAVEVLGAEGAGEQEQELPGALSSAAGLATPAGKAAAFSGRASDRNQASGDGVEFLDAAARRPAPSSNVPHAL